MYQMYKQNHILQCSDSCYRFSQIVQYADCTNSSVTGCENIVGAFVKTQHLY